MVNIMDEYVSYNKKVINNYMKLILESKYKKELVEPFTEVYLNTRYTSYTEEGEVPNLTKRLNLVINQKALELRNDDNKNYISFLVSVYKRVPALEQLYFLVNQKKAVNDISELRKRYFGLVDDDFIEKFNTCLREDIKKRKDFLDSFNSDVFYLSISKIAKNNNMLYVLVKNKIKFPSLYSEDAILKVAQKDVILEDTLLIGYNLLAIDVLNELLNCNYDKKYYIDFPSSILEKKTKLNRLLGVIDNEFMLDKIRLIIDFKCFKRYRTYILELMRAGFVFAIYLDESFDFCSDNVEYLVTFEKIFMEKDKYYYKDMLKDGKIKDRIVIVDGVM